MLQFFNLLSTGPVVLTLLFFPLVPLSYRVCGVLYIIFHGQVLLSALSCCSACTAVSEAVFLMYLWTEMDSTSTYSSAILFLKILIHSNHIGVIDVILNAGEGLFKLEKILHNWFKD